MSRIGFMQGRLSPRVGGRIQAFPALHWRDEFVLAERHGFPLMEWTLDHDGIDENPLMTPEGRAEITALCRRHGLSIQSLTGDCFMQAPFYKATGAAAVALRDELRRVVDASIAAGIRYIVVPLVDGGIVTSPDEAGRLRQGLEEMLPALRDGNVRILFESDLPPLDLRQFIAGFPADCFGINYDIGNSASLGHDPVAEIAAYATRIDNVHVKDRVLGGTTVPLGQGAADLPRVFRLLRDAGYRGDYILQTARAEDGAHDAALCRYRDMVAGWLAAER